MPKDEGHIRPLVSLLSGGIAGGVETVATYPFEFVKTRVQLRQQPGKPTPSNPFLIITQVYRHEGFRALYKGCAALAIGSVGKDAVRFLSFDTVKNAFKDKETGALSPMRSLGAGMVAGIMASICAVTPTERIKTALIDDARGDKLYRSTTHCIKTILREDGFTGLYRGFAGTTMKQASASSIRLGSYNIIKEFERKRGWEQGVGMNFVNGSAAGTIATLTTQPFDVVKTRSQAAKATTTVEAFVGILRDDGIRGFWRGTYMRLGRTVFSGG